MKRILLCAAFLLLAGLCFGQSSQNNYTWPVNGPNLPGSCRVGQMFSKTSDPVGLYTAINSNPCMWNMLVPGLHTAADVKSMAAASAFDYNTLTARPAAAAMSGMPNSYAGTAEYVHPSVVFFPAGWNGYKYWMAITPYKNTDSQYENPSIYQSQDGQTWAAPAGVTNPLVAYPGGTTYNSDPDLVDGLDGKLYLFYRRTGDGNDTYFYLSSSDGSTWSAPKQTYQVASATERPVSPGIIFDGSQWVMYYVDIVNSPTNVLVRRTASSPAGPWSVATNPTGLSTPGGKMLWHLAAKNVGGRIVLLLDYTDSGASSGGQLYFAWSDDNGATFTQAGSAVLQTSVPSEAMYRATFLPVAVGSQMRFAIWYTNISWALKYTITDVVAAPWSYADYFDMQLLRSISHVGTGVMGDNFNRADNASTLGTGPSGHVWTNDTGAIGVSSRLAYLPSAANSKAIFNAGTQNGRFLCQVAVLGSGQDWCIFRWTDTSNYWRVGHGAAGIILLQKVVTGTPANLTCIAALPSVCGQAGAAGDRFEAVLSGDVVTVYLNGQMIYTATDAFSDTGTKYGLQSADVTARWSAVAFIGAANTTPQPARPAAVYKVAGDYPTSTANLEAITGLVITLPPNSPATYSVDCYFAYSQATAAVADSFGVQAATYNPTNIFGTGKMTITAGPPSTYVYGALPTLATTTATPVVTATPGATATVYDADMHLTVENPANASAQVLNIMAKTSTSGDVLTVKRGSKCVVSPSD